MTKIEWTNKTWNIITGCTHKSEGCQNCYAEKMHKRLSAMGQKKYTEPFNKVIFHPEELKRTFGKKHCLIFVNSMSDTFHEKIDDLEIAQILDTCFTNKKHTFQILTKRAKRLPDFRYPQNVWLGVTVEKAEYKNRIEYLRETDAKIKFLSCEPLLEDLGELDLSGIDWVIVGGESGINARPCHPDWVRNIQRQCKEQGVAFFFKQWGEWANIKQVDYSVIKTNFNTAFVGNSECVLNIQIDKETGTYKFGKKYTGCLLDGREYKEYPKLKGEQNENN